MKPSIDEEAKKLASTFEGEGERLERRQVHEFLVNGRILRHFMLSFFIILYPKFSYGPGDKRFEAIAEND